MDKITYTKQPDGTIVSVRELADPLDTVAMLNDKRANIQGQYDFLQKIVDEHLPAIVQQLADLDAQIAALTPLVDVKPVDPVDPLPVDTEPVNTLVIEAK